ncbi:alpha/beta fold hydrolase [Mediterraneibacter agrestimuris]|uniref:alpha/beta fold hydrolase n=1 Tax=Mediterraneibacter agrestimuris TaxID=2941333 RepID=UPI00204170B1|nr:alpha/beta fold hydrolase [Mediterraneibacter agrestimuris]
MKYIFLHGLGQVHSDWSDMIEGLDNEMDILCPNLSEWLSGKKASYFNLYHAMETYCEQQKEPIHLSGLSLGGILALHYTLEHPEKVASLVLMGTQYTMPKRMLRFQNMIFYLMPDKTFWKMGFGKKDFISLTKSMMDLNFKKDLPKINCKVLILCGEKDKVNKSASIELEQQISNAEFKIVPHAGHEINKENPVELAKIINRFYSGL